MTNLAFHNDPELAARIREQVRAHTLADEIIQGTYWENGKGCFIGCLAHSDSVQTVEDLTGYPAVLTKIAESIFEGLPNAGAKTFPQRMMDATTTGADLSLVAWKFLHWLVDDVLREYGTDEVRAACSPALDIVAAKSRGEEVSPAAARAARAAAAAARAADAAAYAAAYAAYAAARAAYAAAYASAYAAYAAARAADAAARAADAARARIRQADKLIALMQDAATNGAHDNGNG